MQNRPKTHMACVSQIRVEWGWLEDVALEKWERCSILSQDVPNGSLSINPSRKVVRGTLNARLERAILKDYVHHVNNNLVARWRPLAR